MRVALAGLDSSRPIRIARHIATLGSAGHRITALATEGMTPSTELLSLLDPGLSLVERLEDLIGRADVVLEFGRAAAERPARVLPLLGVGLPVLVDKPLSLTSDAARLLADRAQRSGVALLADSGYRTAPALDLLRERGHPDTGPESLLCISGPADPGSPWGGLAFYGSHHAQVLQELRPDALAETVPLEVRLDPGRHEISVQVGERAQLRFTGPEGARGFTVAIGDRTVPLAPAPDYLERLIDRFLAECAAPRHDDAWRRELVDPVALLERITAELPRFR